MNANQKCSYVLWIVFLEVLEKDFLLLIGQETNYATTLNLFFDLRRGILGNLFVVNGYAKDER